VVHEKQMCCLLWELVRSKGRAKKHISHGSYSLLMIDDDQLIESIQNGLGCVNYLI